MAAATTDGLQTAGNFTVKETSFIAMVGLASCQTIRNHVVTAIALRIDCIVVVNAARITTAAVSLDFTKISSWEQAEGAKIDFSSLRNYFVVSLVADNLKEH